MLTVVKDLGLRDFFTGQVPIVSGEIAEDFTQYFVVSEQVPSAVALGVLVNPDNTVKAAGGFIIQVMPGATDETISNWKNEFRQWNRFRQLIDSGLTPEEILNEVLGSENVEILDGWMFHLNVIVQKNDLATQLLVLVKKKLVK